MQERYLTLVDATYYHKNDAKWILLQIYNTVCSCAVF
jgi:hypothetical protein